MILQVSKHVHSLGYWAKPLWLPQSTAMDFEVATGYGLSPPSRKKHGAVAAAKLLALLGFLVREGCLALQGEPQTAR